MIATLKAKIRGRLYLFGWARSHGATLWGAIECGLIAGMHAWDYDETDKLETRARCRACGAVQGGES
jgi:hypothetical protein